MKKDFDSWNKYKKTINSKRKNIPFYHAREVWWCSLGVNVGFEQDGTGKNFDRPVVIVRGFNRNTCLAVALTGRKKKGKYYLYLGIIDGVEASAVLSQIRLVDTKRLIRKMATLNGEIYKKLQEKIVDMILEKENK